MAKIKLQKVMYDKDITYNQLARMTGINKTMLFRIANGIRSPQIDQLEIIAKALKMRIDDFYDSEYK